MTFGLFKKKQEELVVPEQQLLGWFEPRERDILLRLDASLTDQRKEVREIVTRCREHIRGLLVAELHNKNVMERELSLMTGNREFYSRRVSQFLDSLDIPSSYNELLDYSKDFPTKLTELGKATSRSYFVLQQFFANEAGRIAQDLKLLEKAISALGETIDHSPFHGLSAIRDGINSLSSDREKEHSLKGQVSHLMNELHELTIDIQKMDHERERLLVSKEVKDCSLLAENIAGVADEIKMMEKELFSRFSEIDDALKKYRYIATDSAVASRYEASPLQALLTDESFAISDELDKMKILIDKGEIELKDRKKGKIQESVTKLAKEYLVSFKGKYLGLMGEKEGLQKRYDSNKQLKRIKEIEHHLIIVNEKKRVKENIITGMNRQIEHLDIIGVIKTLESDIEGIFNAKITIKPL